MCPGVPEDRGCSAADPDPYGPRSRLPTGHSSVTPPHDELRGWAGAPGDPGGVALHEPETAAGRGVRSCRAHGRRARVGHRVLAQPRGRADAYAGRGAARLPAGVCATTRACCRCTRRRTSCSARRSPPTAASASACSSSPRQRQEGHRQLRAGHLHAGRRTQVPPEGREQGAAALLEQQVGLSPVLAARHRPRQAVPGGRREGDRRDDDRLHAQVPGGEDYSLAWSLGIATGLAIGSALLAQAAATTVLKPVHRLGIAARRLGEGKLDTRLRVSGTDELADLSLERRTTPRSPWRSAWPT